MYFLPLYLLKITQNLFLRYKYQNSKVYLYVQGCLCAPFLLDYLLFVHIQCIFFFFRIASDKGRYSYSVAHYVC